jgi:hypothetical protein
MLDDERCRRMAVSQSVIPLHFRILIALLDGAKDRNQLVHPHIQVVTHEICGRLDPRPPSKRWTPRFRTALRMSRNRPVVFWKWARSGTLEAASGPPLEKDMRRCHHAIPGYRMPREAVIASILTNRQSLLRIPLPALTSRQVHLGIPGERWVR